MKFTPRLHANGSVCCSNPKYLCDNCTAHFRRQGIRGAGTRDSATSRMPPDPYAPGLAAMRAAAGARNSASDQSHLNAIHDHATAAGAYCPAADSDSERFQVVKNAAAAKRTASERVAHAIQGYGSVVLKTPDPYARAAESAPLDLTPDLDPTYQPRGTPPDGYAIAIAARRAVKEA
jgi:hypothetical protein